MPERDYVGILTVGYKGIIDIDELYKTIYKWFVAHDSSNVREIDYREFKEGGINKLEIKWEADRKQSEYLKYYYEITLKADDVKEVIVEKKKKYNCSVVISFTGYLLHDYEETWTTKSWLKFLRECYDKFIIGNKNAAHQKALEMTLKDLIAEVKSYLNLTKSP